MHIDQLANKGLNQYQADQLLKTYGYNEIPRTRSFILIKSFIGQFNNFLTVLLIFAAIVSFYFHEQIDGFFIFGVVLLNAVLGTFQEAKAERSLQILKKMTVSTVRVIRDQVETNIDSRLLVPGDILHVESGVKVPADCRILLSRHLEVNEAALTGESLPVLKHEEDKKNNSLFMGTLITSGRGYVIVTKTGSSTRFGALAGKLVSIQDEKTPLTIKLEKFSRQLGYIGILLCLGLFFLIYARDKNIFESFFFAVSLAVAAVPEGLPAVMTVALSIGVERMAKKGAIIRKLSAIEGIGSITVLATDKTGTLTTGVMRVSKIWCNDMFVDISKKISSQTVFNLFATTGIVCSTTLLEKKGQESSYIGDPTEAAFLLFAEKNGFDIAKIKKNWNIVDEFAFDSIKKIMTVIATTGKEITAFSKGAPEEILKMCSHVEKNGQQITLTNETKHSIVQQYENEAKNGYRIIAFSYKIDDITHVDKEQTFLGFICIDDPIREEARAAVLKAKVAGIKVVMITGDNQLTATRIGIETGILTKDDNVILGSEIDSYSDSELKKILPKACIFARTTPEHKYRIVSLYQQLGEIVAVTGDGVNDVLALKQADIGVAMGLTGTDVARETADIVLTDDNFATLVNAIEEGRNIFTHIKHAITYLLTTNSAEVFTVLLSVILGFPPILTALQILYMNLITDSPPSLALAFAPNNVNIMRQKMDQSKNLLHNREWKYIGLYGLIGGFLALVSFIVGLRIADLPTAQTMALTTILFIQPFVFADLWISQKLMLSHLKLFASGIFIIAFALPFMLHIPLLYVRELQILFATTGLQIKYILLATFYAFGILGALEVRKITSLFRR